MLNRYPLLSGRKYLVLLLADARQPWTDLCDSYSEYLIIYFDYLIIPFDYLIIG